MYYYLSCLSYFFDFSDCSGDLGAGEAMCRLCFTSTTSTSNTSNHIHKQPYLFHICNTTYILSGLSARMRSVRMNIQRSIIELTIVRMRRQGRGRARREMLMKCCSVIHICCMRIPTNLE